MGYALVGIVDYIEVLMKAFHMAKNGLQYIGAIFQIPQAINNRIKPL
jgi:hypothetical protein